MVQLFLYFQLKVSILVNMADDSGPKDPVHHVTIKLLCLHGLIIGLPKCVFTIPELKFLGHQLSSSGCSPLDKHTSTISSFPPPSDKPALQRFLGMLNLYRKFIKNAALVLAPLTNALKGPGKRLDWTPPLDAAFYHAQDLLSTVLVLVHPVPGAPFALAADTSDSHFRGVLMQREQKSWSPLAFFSRKETSSCLLHHPLFLVPPRR